MLITLVRFCIQTKFSDVNPEKKADEIFSFLVGKAVYDTMRENYGGFTKLIKKFKS